MKGIENSSRLKIILNRYKREQIGLRTAKLENHFFPQNSADVRTNMYYKKKHFIQKPKEGFLLCQITETAHMACSLRHTKIISQKCNTHFSIA